MNAVIGLGAPWYTSGVHMWNGTAEILNAEPDDQERDPREQRAVLEQRVLHGGTAAIPVSDAEPVAP